MAQICCCVHIIHMAKLCVSIRWAACIDRILSSLLISGAASISGAGDPGLLIDCTNRTKPLNCFHKPPAWTVERDDVIR